jgi:hypothetical protein
MNSISAIIFASVFITGLLVGCREDKLQDPDQVNPENSLVLSSTKNNLSIGGETTRIYARVPLGAGIIDVSFSTSLGAFIQKGPKATEIKQLSDSVANGFRWAAVTLASDLTTKGTVFITAEAKGQRQRITLSFK